MFKLLPSSSSISPAEDGRYQEIDEIGTGAHGTVYKARDLKSESAENGEFVALKRVKISNTNEEGLPVSTVREIALLKQVNQIGHENIVKLLDVFHTPQNMLQREIWLTLVFEHIEQDLTTYLERCPPPGLSEWRIKSIMRQVLSGVEFLHLNRVVHRDLKPQNILITCDGKVKVADFGLARIYGFSMILTSVVVTLWYRSPEVLLHCDYATSVDIWSLGCIFAELYNRQALFEGKNECNQLDKIFRVIGSPSEEDWPEYCSLPWGQFTRYPRKPLKNHIPEMSESGLDLLRRMIRYSALERIDARSALKHRYFDELNEEAENKENYDGSERFHICQNRQQNGDITALKDSTNEDPTRPLRYVKDPECNADKNMHS